MKNLRLLIWASRVDCRLGFVTPVLPQSGCGSEHVTSCGCLIPAKYRRLLAPLLNP